MLMCGFLQEGWSRQPHPTEVLDHGAGELTLKTCPSTSTLTGADDWLRPNRTTGDIGSGTDTASAGVAADYSGTAGADRGTGSGNQAAEGAQGQTQEWAKPDGCGDRKARGRGIGRRSQTRPPTVEDRHAENPRRKSDSP